MTSINPFSGYLAQGSQIDRTQAADKSRQVRKTQELAKNIALQDDQLEHQVESSDAIASIRDDQASHQDQQQKGQPRKPHDKDDTPPSLDITA